MICKDYTDRSGRTHVCFKATYQGFVLSLVYVWSLFHTRILADPALIGDTTGELIHLGKVDSNAINDTAIWAIPLSKRRIVDRAKPRNGFTLIEVMVAIAITAMVLTGLTIVIHQLGLGSTKSLNAGTQYKYLRALDVIHSDVRGLLTIEALTQQQTRYGEPLALFATTHRIDAIEHGRWTGVALVGYWFEEASSGGKTLWRSELPIRSAQDKTTWTSLCRDLGTIEITLLLEGKWKIWPSAQEDIKAHPTAIRIVAKALEDQIRAATALPTAIFLTAQRGTKAERMGDEML